MAKSTAKAVIQKSRRGAGQDDWGRIDIKVVCGLVNEAKAEVIEGLVVDALADLEEEITGQRPMFDKDGNAETKKTPAAIAKGQSPLPLGRTDQKPVARPGKKK